jgi:hypothetical protein
LLTALIVLSVAAIIEGQPKPSIFLAKSRQAVVSGCSIESYTNPQLLTRGSDVVMDVELIGTERYRASRATLGAAANLDKNNFRYACPKGKQFQVWWDPRYPDRPYHNWWKMLPIFTLLFGVPIALFVCANLNALPTDAGSGP